MCMNEKIVYVVCKNEREKRMISQVDAQGLIYTEDILKAIRIDSELAAAHFIEFLVSILPEGLSGDYFVIKVVNLKNIL